MYPECSSQRGQPCYAGDTERERSFSINRCKWHSGILKNRCCHFIKTVDSLDTVMSCAHPAKIFWTNTMFCIFGRHLSNIYLNKKNAKKCSLPMSLLIAGHHIFLKIKRNWTCKSCFHSHKTLPRIFLPSSMCYTPSTWPFLGINNFR